MEAHANGHTFLHPRERYGASASILTSITVEEVNSVAKELCEHLSHMDGNKGVMPAAVVACAPVLDRSGTTSPFHLSPFFMYHSVGVITSCSRRLSYHKPLLCCVSFLLPNFLNIFYFLCCPGAPFLLSEEEVGAAITEALQTPLLPLEDKTVPTTLLSVATVQALVQQAQPGFVVDTRIGESGWQVVMEDAKAIRSGGCGILNVEDSSHSIQDGASTFLRKERQGLLPNPVLTIPTTREGILNADQSTTLGVVQRRLTNGMKVNLKSLDAESQRVSMRLYIPGGFYFTAFCCCLIRKIFYCGMGHM